LLTALFISSLSFSQEGVELCKSCHGPDGNSVIPGTPSIAGQPKLFIENQLVLFREELRRSPVMMPIVKGMKDADIVKLAEHFSKLPAKVVSASALDKVQMKKGEILAKKLRCGICHLSDFSGQNQIPRLGAQREEYLDAEMRAYRDNTRSGGDTIMAATLYGVKDDEIKALAHFLSRVAPAAAKPAGKAEKKR
jgi:cytochrome c553